MAKIYHHWRVNFHQALLGILLLTLPSCGFTAVSAGKTTLPPNQALSVYVTASKNSTYSPAINLAVETELRKILAREQILSQIEYLADFTLDLTVTSVAHTQSAITGADFNYYRQNFKIVAKVQLSDQRNPQVYSSAAPGVISFTSDASYTYNTKYSDPYAGEIDAGLFKTARELASEIVQDMDYNF